MRSPDFALIKDRIWAGGARREDLVKRVARSLRDQILSGQMAPGAKFVAEAELARHLAVSRPSLREAIRILAHEGLVEVKHGVGTFVSTGRKPMVGSLELMRSMTDLIREAGGEPSHRGLDIRLERASAEVSEALDLPHGAEVGHISRVRLINGRPFVRANEFVVLDDRRSFEALAAFDGSSLYRFLREDLGAVISHSKSRIAAVAADAAMAQLLEMPRKAPMILMTEVHYGADGKPVLLAINHHNSEVVQFTSMRWGMPL